MKIRRIKVNASFRHEDALDSKNSIQVDPEDITARRQQAAADMIKRYFDNGDNLGGDRSPLPNLPKSDSGGAELPLPPEE